MFIVKCTPEMGRGLYATKFLEPGTVLFIAELLVLNEIDTIRVNQTELRDYTFHYSETQDCLVLGYGELFNHSSEPNVHYELVELDGRKFMKFSIIRPVHPDEQLFIDYSADTRRLGLTNNATYSSNLIGDDKDHCELSMRIGE